MKHVVANSWRGFGIGCQRIAPSLGTVAKRGMGVFVPSQHAQFSEEQADDLATFVAASNGRLMVISGAGLSTESGIPDYRSPEGSYSKGHVPMTHHEFVSKPLSRARYWARSLKGYQYFSSRKPNASHFTIAKWQRMGLVQSLITQNVDRLHRSAGHKGEIEIHGNANEVGCLDCLQKRCRSEWTSEIARLNQDWIVANMPELRAPPKKGPNDVQDIRADGDAHLNTSDFEDFVVPACSDCSGTMMPSVVFFGGYLQNSVRQAADKAVEHASHILVLGSTCQTLSVFRLLRDAHESNKPIASVTIGASRADDLLSLKIEAPITSVLRDVDLRLEQMSSIGITQ